MGMSNSRKKFIKKQVYALNKALKRMEKGLPVDRNKKFYVPSQEELHEAFDIPFDPDGERTPAPLWALQSDEAYIRWCKSLKNS